MTDLDREEHRIPAPMQEVLVQYYGEVVHVDIHVARISMGNIRHTCSYTCTLVQTGQLKCKFCLSVSKELEGITYMS